jgi:hypothetical protein
LAEGHGLNSIDNVGRTNGTLSGPSTMERSMPDASVAKLLDEQADRRRLSVAVVDQLKGAEICLLFAVYAQKRMAEADQIDCRVRPI